MRTFRYILSLLAATLALLAQPAMAQAPETSTKAQPSDPVFPYLLTIQQPAEGATLDVMIMNAAGTYTAVSSGQTVYNGTKVDLFFAPQEGYRLTEGSITYNGNATTAETLAPNDKGYTAQRSFTMPAQPVTVGKRAALWMQDFRSDLEELDHVLATLRFLGCRGTTGTEASFMDLFEGDGAKIDEMNRRIAAAFGFERCFSVCGQTYPRKTDSRILNVLSSIAQSAYRMANDIRLLQHDRQVEEPFEKTQIGSSAMAYKRNPMRSERIASLSRYVMIDALNPAITSATQWFERTLDDSANKRLSVPEGFLAIDGILDLCLNVVDGLVVYPKVIEKRLMSELPFMATENIMMDAVKAGGDRQELHERIRELSMEAGKNVKENGLDNNLLELIAEDQAFNMSLEDLKKTMDPAKYVGRAREQVDAYLKNVIYPLLQENEKELGMKAEINV